MIFTDFQWFSQTFPDISSVLKAFDAKKSSPQDLRSTLKKELSKLKKQRSTARCAASYFYLVIGDIQHACIAYVFYMLFIVVSCRYTVAGNMEELLFALKSVLKRFLKRCGKDDLFDPCTSLFGPGHYFGSTSEIHEEVTRLASK